LGFKGYDTPPTALEVQAALNELPGGWEPVRDLYGAHLCVMGGVCAAMLTASWVRLKALLRQG